MSRKLDGKIAVVTGGSTGIGLATAKRFASEGAHVIVTGRRQAELDAATSEIGNATGIRIDSSNMAELDALFDRVKSEKGRIDVLFVNAGGGSLLPLGNITEEQYDDTFGRNVKGVLFTVQKALPLLADGASVILTGSTAASGAPRHSVSMPPQRPPSAHSPEIGFWISRAAASGSTRSAPAPPRRQACLI